MKIIQPKNTKKAVFVVSITVLLVVAAIALTSYLKVGPFSPKNNDQINLSNPTSEEIKAGEQAKKQTLDQVDNKSNSAGSDPIPAPQPIEGSDKKSVHMEITASNQDQSTLYVRSMIQTVANTGTCTLTMTHPSHSPYTATADVQALPSSTTCKGFNIPLEQLAQGTWKITLSFTNNELTASTEKDVTIQ